MDAFMNTEYSGEQLTRDDLIRLKDIVLGSLKTRVYQAPVARRYARESDDACSLPRRRAELSPWRAW